MNINDSTGLGCARFEIREKHAAKGIIRVLIKNDEATPWIRIDLAKGKLINRFVKSKTIRENHRRFDVCSREIVL